MTCKHSRPGPLAGLFRSAAPSDHACIQALAGRLGEGHTVRSAHSGRRPGCQRSTRLARPHDDAQTVPRDSRSSALTGGQPRPGPMDAHRGAHSPALCGRQRSRARPPAPRRPPKPAQRHGRGKPPCSAQRSISRLATTLNVRQNQLHRSSVDDEFLGSASTYRCKRTSDCVASSPCQCAAHTCNKAYSDELSPAQLKAEEQALVCFTPAQHGHAAAPSRNGAAVASTAPGARPSAWLERPIAANSSSAAASPPASSAARLPDQ